MREGPWPKRRTSHGQKCRLGCLSELSNRDDVQGSKARQQSLGLVLGEFFRWLWREHVQSISPWKTLPSSSATRRAPGSADG